MTSRIKVAKIPQAAPDDPSEVQAEHAAKLLGPARPTPAAIGDRKRDVIPPNRELSPDSFHGQGDALPSRARGFFEQRFDHDFRSVRVHHGPVANRSARSLGARAYTYGSDIVFGPGEYSPESRRGTTLLAHELTHVVQQGGRPQLLQCSALSDSVKSAWTVEPKLEALLARLSESDVQSAQNDADVDAEIARILNGRPDDLYIAQRIRKGQLGTTTGATGKLSKPGPGGKPVPRAVEAVFFRGATDKRALVIAGVHGSEQQGIQVARMMIQDLKTKKPVYTVIVVPTLFPDNASVRAREFSTPTNRNFPKPSEDLSAATKRGKGTAVDAEGRPILPENIMLLQLIERFHPERIISIHGTSGAGSAGVFYDRRTLSEGEIRAARQWASGEAYMKVPPEEQETPAGREKLKEFEEESFQKKIAQMSGQAQQTDFDLSIAAAKKIDTSTTSITGRESRGMSRENETLTAENRKKRQAHPSVAGNVGASGDIDFATWSGSVPGGVSLGGYAPNRGMSVFTVEPPLNLSTGDYPTSADAKVDQEERRIELQEYANAVRTVLLGQ
jgi:Domain of unknown function (DUF4157)/Succinylglutamate desuccinylase / Aspartoacylase family